MLTPPNVILQNKLDYDVIFYGVCESGAAVAGLTHYCGGLRLMSAVTSGASAEVPAVCGAGAAYLACDANGQPLALRIMPIDPLAPAIFCVDHADLERMAASASFIELVLGHPDDPLVTGFKTLLTGTDGTSQIDRYFASHAPYKACTFASYLIAGMAQARSLDQSKGGASTAYSLARLCNLLGGDWPAGFPDITVCDFSCSESKGALLLGGYIDVASLPFAPGCGAYMRSLLPQQTRLQVSFQFRCALEAGLHGTRIGFSLEGLPLGAGAMLKQPSISLDINPLFQFVTLNAHAALPFSLFDNPPFQAVMALTLDHAEPAVAVRLDGAVHGLLAPPEVKGVHLGPFRIVMDVDQASNGAAGAGYTLGLQGKFHLDLPRIALADDGFALACELDGDLAQARYLAFYVPHMMLNDLVANFSNSTAKLDFPVPVHNMGFKWAAAARPALLPDGAWAAPGFGFSGELQVLGMPFLGDIAIDPDHGLNGLLAMAPFSAGPLQVDGNGAGASVKVDGRGAAVRNNQIAGSAAARAALAQAGDRQLLAPGGAQLSVSSSGGTPALSLQASLSLFELRRQAVDAAVTDCGIEFDLDFGDVLQTRMHCALPDFHNFTSAYSYGLERDIVLPTVAGFVLGQIALDASCTTLLRLESSGPAPVLTVQGSFHFEGWTLNIGPFTADHHVTTITELNQTMTNYLLRHADDIFGYFIKDASRWAGLVYKGAIKGVGAVANGLQLVFGKSEHEVAHIMSAVGYASEDAAFALKRTFSSSAGEVAKLLKGAYGSTAGSTAGALRHADYGIGDISLAMSSVFGLVPGDINTILQGLGYSVDIIKQAFEALGGEFASFADGAWGSIVHVLNPGNW